MSAQGKNYPKISIVIPSYNQGRFIRETIDSVLNQNYPDVEVIVMDGGSTDETVSVLKEYGEKISWVSKKDNGQTDAINQGMKKAKGEIVAYINSDDVYLPNTFFTVAEYFMQHPKTMWATGDYFIIDAEGRKIQSYVAWYKTMLRQQPTFSKLSVANYIIQPSTFWRRSVYKEVGMFDESLRYCMDYDFWMRLIQKHPLAVIKNHFSLFRIHSLSKGGSQYEKQFAEEHTVLLRYTKNPVLLVLHKLHAFLVIMIYKGIK
jgi:glycosyltransferase involved in cell wall biosynthesis